MWVGTRLRPVKLYTPGKFDWRQSDKFAMLTGPSAAYGGAKFAEIGFPIGFALQVRLEVSLNRCSFPSLTALALYCQGLRDLGPCLSATSAFMTLQGVETLSLRAQRICENALALAKYAFRSLSSRVL
jgi:O-acetylhomoserine/O-acetylserine sulfhydrylase